MHALGQGKCMRPGLYYCTALLQEVQSGRRRRRWRAGPRAKNNRKGRANGFKQAQPRRPLYVSHAAPSHQATPCVCL